MGVSLLAVSQACLEAADPATVTRSTASMATFNVQSVAEAAALAGAVDLANDAGRPNAHGIAPAESYQQDVSTDATASGSLAHQPKPTPRLLQPRVVVGPVTCALADTTTP
jgi:Cobalamin synthesis G C-terminus